jgi:hypothetical protein
MCNCGGGTRQYTVTYPDARPAETHSTALAARIAANKVPGAIVSTPTTRTPATSGG